MDEASTLASIYRRWQDRQPDVSPRLLVGPGDDCALLATAPHTLAKVDSVVEHVHFSSTTPIDAIARKALARPLSDIAAMAGTPIASLAACVLPQKFSQTKALVDALYRWATYFNCPTIGGDIVVHRSNLGSSSTPQFPDSPLSLTITIIADTHPTSLPLRSNAIASDDVYVSGQLGGSLGSDLLGRHLSFEPRLSEARWLADTLGPALHAMMDVSDGLGIDSGRLGDASNVTLALDAARIPIHPDAMARPSPLDAAIADGEDYELLFTCTHGTLPDSLTIPASNSSQPPTQLTRIGRVIPRDVVGSHLLQNNKIIPLASRGYNHSTPY